MHSDWPERCQEIVRRARAALSEQPAADPWRPLGLTLEAALNRGDDPALLMDENSPLRDELRRLLAGQSNEPVAHPAPVERVALSGEQIDALRRLNASIGWLVYGKPCKAGIGAADMLVIRDLLGSLGAYVEVDGITPAQGKEHP